jgi:hypothetical protein
MQKVSIGKDCYQYQYSYDIVDNIVVIKYPDLSMFVNGYTDVCVMHDVEYSMYDIGIVVGIDEE